MKTILVESGQCAMDIAMQCYGSISSLPTLLADNDLAFDDALTPGMALQIREELSTANPRIVQYYKNRAHVVNKYPSRIIDIHFGNQ